MPICLYPNASVKLFTHAVICQTHGIFWECGIMLIRLYTNFDLDLYYLVTVRHLQ